MNAGKATGSCKRKVKQVLNSPYQFEPIGELIARIKLHMPKEVRNELWEDKNKEVEAVAKLWNEVLAGPLKVFTTDKQRLEYAVEYFVTSEGKRWSKYYAHKSCGDGDLQAVVRERFLPHATDGTATTPINASRYNAPITTGSGPVASFTDVRQLDDPVVQLVNQVVSGNGPIGLTPATAINNGASGLHVPSVSPVVEVPTLAQNMDLPTTNQTTGPATTARLGVARHRRVRSDPGLNAICHKCGNIHSGVAAPYTAGSGAGFRGIKNNDGTLRKLVRNAWGPVVYILVGAGLTQLMKGYSKV